MQGWPPPGSQLRPVPPLAAAPPSGGRPLHPWPFGVEVRVRAKAKIGVRAKPKVGGKTHLVPHLFNASRGHR